MNDLSIDAAGVSLAASVYGPADASADAPPVLFLHGISNARDVWYDWAVEFSDRYRVYTLDFRGHGHSARVPRYTIDGFIADAAAVLAAIGVPTRVVGHSLGGVVAGALAQTDNALVHSALLVDPAWYFGVPDEFNQTAYPARFELLSGLQRRLHAEHAPLATWVAFVGNTAHPYGGVFADHMRARQILSHASGLQRHDPHFWDTTIFEIMATLDPAQPFRRHAQLIHCDDRMGAACLVRHAEMIRTANPSMQTMHYEGSDHFPQRTYRFAERFRSDLTAFLAQA